MCLLIKAYAKINLFLDILDKRDDGFHEVKMVMQSISLADEVIMEKQVEGISFSTDSQEIPSDESNLAYKAAVSLKRRFNIKEGVKITLNKVIPVAAGLAGGSADAAAVLRGLNKIWALNLSVQELMEIGAELGSDIPFCIVGGTKLALGRGEILEELPDLPSCYVVIVKPSFSISTAWAYQAYSRLLSGKAPLASYDVISAALEQNDLALLAKNMENVLVNVAEKEHPEINILREIFLENGALGAMMSGSGPTVFGIFENEDKAQKTVEDFKKISFVERVFIVVTTKAEKE